MIKTKFIVGTALLASSWVVTSCAPGTPATKSGAISRSEIISNITARIVRYSVAYDVMVTDVRTSPNVTVVCGLIRSAGKRPHTFLSIDYEPADDQIPLIMPSLIGDGSWEGENNSRISDNIVQQCRGAGVPIERPPA